MVNYVRFYRDTLFAAPYIMAAVERTASAPGSDSLRYRKGLLIHYELFVTRNKPAALDRLRQAMPDDWKENYGELGFFSYWCLKNNINLPEAKELAVKALGVAKQGEDAESQVKNTGRTLTRICLALGDSAEAVTYHKASQPEGWMEDAERLNSVAWWCFKHSLNLEEAESLGRRGVELAVPGKEKAMILDTLAEICNARGSSAEALALIEEAVQEDPENPYYAEQLDRFNELVALE